MVVRFVVWLHLMVLRLATRLVGLGLKGVGKWVLVILALLGEEFRRYAGLVLSGAIIVGFGKLFLSLPELPGKRWVILADLLFLAVWALAVRRAVRFTMRNSVARVRNKQAIKGMAADIAVVRGRVNDGLARRAKGTPLEGAWSSNRSARIEEQAAAQRAAEQAAEKAERDRMTRENDDRERDRLAELEPNPFT